MEVVAVWTSVASKNVKTVVHVVMVLVVIAVAHLRVVVMVPRLVAMAVVVVVVIVRVVLVDPAALDKGKVVVPRAVMVLREPALDPVARVVVEIVISAAARGTLVIVAAMTARSVSGWRCRKISRS